MGMEIAGWCVYIEGEFDRFLLGDRKLREIQYPGQTCIYAENEEDAKELSGKIEGSKFGAYYKLDFGSNYSPDYAGPRNY